MSNEIANQTQGLALATLDDMDKALRVFDQAGHKPGDLALKFAVASGLGMSLAQALSDVYIIEGRPSLSATSQLALIRRAGVRTRWLESSRETATLRMWLANDPDPFDTTYTIADAKAAGLVGRKTWASHADAMLRARCITKAIRMHCPEMLACTLYDPDEITVEEPVRVEVQRPALPGGAAVKREPAPMEGEIVSEAPAGCPPKLRDRLASLGWLADAEAHVQCDHPSWDAAMVQAVTAWATERKAREADASTVPSGDAAVGEE